MFIIGDFGMGFSHIMAAVCLLKEWYLVAFCCMTLFIAFFNLTVGNVTFIYTAEISVDSAAGIALAIQFVHMTQISFTVEYMIGGFF